MFHQHATKTNALLIALLFGGVLLFLPEFSYAFSISATIYDLVHTVFGALVRLGGLSLNYAVTTYVAGFGDVFLNKGVGFAVDRVWVVVRDVFNLLFIFGLVFIGLRLILDSGNSSAKRMLGMLIAAGLLVNFSLLISKTVVDFSNLAAAQIANGFEYREGEYKVSESFMNVLGLQTVYQNGPASEGPSDDDPEPSWAEIVGTMVLFTVAGFVFFAGGILLIIRFAILNIYMILSPVMFLGWVFPGMQRYTSEYWSGFLGRCFFAPAYILMIYLSYRVLFEMKTYVSSDLGKAIGGNAAQSKGAIESLAFYILAICFLVASLVVAKNMGAQGASAAVSLGSRGTNWARSKAVGGAKIVGGAAVERALLNPLDRAAASNNPLSRSFGRGLAKIGARDLIAGGTKPLNQFRDNSRKTEKELNQRENKIKRDDAISFGLKNTAELESMRAREKELEELKKKQAAGTITTPESVLLSQRQSQVTAEQERKKFLETADTEMQKSARGLSTKELEEMPSSQREKLVAHLSESQFEALNKSDALTEEDKDKLSGARAQVIQKVLDASGDKFNEEISKLSINQIEALGDEWVQNNAQYLTSGQMEKISDNKNFTQGQKDSYVKARKDGYNDTAAKAGTPDAGEAFKKLLQSRKPTEIAQLPYSVLSKEEALPYINSKVLQEIATKGSLTTIEKANLKAFITSSTLGTSDARGYFTSPQGIRNW